MIISGGDRKEDRIPWVEAAIGGQIKNKERGHKREDIGGEFHERERGGGTQRVDWG